MRYRKIRNKGVEGLDVMVKVYQEQEKVKGIWTYE